MIDVFDGKSLMNISEKIDLFKSLLRKSADNGDDQSIEDLLTIINRNSELMNFIESEPVSKSEIAYKTIILKKLQDSECLKLQSAVDVQTAEASNSEVEDERNVLTNVQITNTNANIQVFKSQTRDIFESNRKLITKVDYDEFTDNVVTFMVTTNSSEAPNYKIMGKNLFNNLLQQFVFENNPNLYQTKRFKQDVYKLYIDNDGSKCRLFIDENHIDLDMGLEGLRYIGRMVSELLNCQVKKVRIFCYYEDISNYLSGVLDEFFGNLQTTLTDLSNSPYVEQEFEFINVFDGQASTHNLTEKVLSEKFTEERKYEVFSNSLCLNLLHKGDNSISADNDNSNGEYHVINGIFLKFFEVMEWNITIGEELLSEILSKLNLFVNKNEHFSFLENVFIDIMIFFFQRASSSPKHLIANSIIHSQLGSVKTESSEDLYESLVADSSFRDFVEGLIKTESYGHMTYCKNLLTDKDFMLSEFSTKLYKTTPLINFIFKGLVEFIELATSIDNVNTMELYLKVGKFLGSRDKKLVIDALKKVSMSIDFDGVDTLLDEVFEADLERSDLFIEYKKINDLQVLQPTMPNYRENFKRPSYLKVDNMEDEPLILAAYNVLSDYYDHLDVPLKMKEMYACYKSSMVEKLGENTYSEDSLVGAFIFVINQMLYSGYYDFDKWTLIKQVINGL